MYKEIVNWYEPVDKLGDAVSVAEMTRWESGFLCGLLKKFRPKKILEVGVSGGGTSVIIRKALEMLGLDETAHFSGDLAEKYYRKSNSDLETGYQYAVACKEGLISGGNHKFFTGKYLPEYIDEIGEGIDFVILDTVHSAPGELLDLLAVLPYLAGTAVVVFHDLAIDHANPFRQFYSINKCLFDSLDGEKYFNVLGNDIDAEMLYGYSDIGAVVIKDKENSIRDLFSMLGLPWAYMLPEKELALYRQKYSEHYGHGYIELLDLIVKVQEHTWKGHSPEGKQQLIDGFKEKISGKKAYLYGTGKRGKRLHHYMKMIGGTAAGWVVSDGYRSEKYLDGLPVYTLSELSALEDEKMVIAASTFSNVIENIEKSGMEYYIPNQFILEQAVLYGNI